MPFTAGFSGALGKPARLNVEQRHRGTHGKDELSSPPRSRRRSPHRRRGEDKEGEITAVGPGGRDENGKLIPIDLKRGDRVLFGKWSGTEVKIDGQDLLIMKESDIMGVIA
jgi:chaperonin GroES